ncbi:SEC-C domain-containing protein [Alicyclobacillus tolerans]|nr:SEC-C metal-binding domain-containing protein [Alicyclobacillus tolerans]MCF8568607.1 SEC-C domain-containing protein [Alicyclobacillus tolerans]
MAPANVYDPCPCGSGKKYKFCCAKKPFELDL